MLYSRISIVITKKIIILLVFSGTMVASAQDSVDSFIVKQVKDQRLAGLSIGIVQNGQIVKAKGYGFANLELNVPATEQTVYKLASVSKQMIATAIMYLQQEGKLRLTDTVTKYFRDAPTAWSNITIRNLLNHTSGLERESPAFNPGLVQPDSVLIRAAYRDPMVFSTGSKWQYCNLGYFMLADIIRQVSGMSFPQFMKKEIFEKYHLSKTQLTSAKTLVPNRADGYVLSKDTITNAEEYLALRPSGAFISTVGDLMKWELMIQHNEILSKDNWKLMLSDIVKTGANNPETEYYGYGWFKSTYKGREIVYHGGSLPGFRTIYFRIPAEGTAIIILTNSDHADSRSIAKGVADILWAKSNN
jgi:CubicO group peptidase (beta-lactamase class C family)